MSLKLNSSGGGSVTLQEPVTASDLTVNLPAANGTVQLEGAAVNIGGNNISAVNSLGFRNRIINGNMAIDQRNNGASGTSADSYTVDRWYIYQVPSSKGTWQQNAGSVTPPNSFKNYLGFTTTSAYSVTSSDEFTITQKIEGFNVSDLGFGTASASTFTFTFWVRSSLTGTFGGAFTNAAADRSYPFSYTISAANTWEQKTITLTGDTTGTWNTTNGAGLAVVFSLGVGSGKSATAGSWQAGKFLSTTGATSVVGTNGATFYITGVQLEAGTVATPFEQIDYGRELIMCERYYEVIATGDISGGAFNASNLFAGLRFRTVKRAAPTMTAVGNGAWVGNNGIGSLNSVTFSGLGVYGGRFDSASFVGTIVQGYAYNFRDFDYRASAEL